MNLVGRYNPRSCESRSHVRIPAVFLRGVPVAGSIQEIRAWFKRPASWVTPLARRPGDLSGRSRKLRRSSGGISGISRRRDCYLRMNHPSLVPFPLPHNILFQRFPVKRKLQTTPDPRLASSASAPGPQPRKKSDLLESFAAPREKVSVGIGDRFQPLPRPSGVRPVRGFVYV